MDPKYEAGQLVRHRASGETAIVMEYESEPPKGAALKLKVSHGFGSEHWCAEWLLEPVQEAGFKA